MSDPVQSETVSEANRLKVVPLMASPHWVISPVKFGAAVCVADGLVLACMVLLHAPLWLWFFLHAALVATATRVAWHYKTTLADITPYALVLMACLIAGPAGALLAVLALVRLARKPLHPELLTAWYDRIALAGDTDKATDLYNTVAMGRALETTTTPPQVFDEVMTKGSLADRQTALGLIARQFSPSYAPALRHALVSPEPVIRVQAAAVAVKVRAELKSTLKAALVRSQELGLTSLEAASLAVDLRAMTRSGLLEDDDRDRGDTAARQLVDRAVDALIATGEQSGEMSLQALALIETEMLRRGNFEAFRQQRQRSARLSGGAHV